MTLPRGIELKGRVTSVGTPVAGVRVTLVEDGPVLGSLLPSHATIANADSEGWTVSDAAGRFSVRVHPVVHHVALRKTGHAPTLVQAHDPRAGETLEVVLQGERDWAAASAVPTAGVWPRWMSSSRGPGVETWRG